jgi:general secretion pathway protein D
MRTFYLSNTVQPQELTEVVTGLRQLLDLKRIQQLNARNAIVIRATPGQLALAEKFIQDIDTAQPEVVVQVSVLEARVDKMRNLGILPGQTASLAIVPPGTTSVNNNNASNNGTNAGTTTPSTTGVLSLQNLSHLNGSDTSVTLPNFTANALLNDSTTRIIQNPELRSVDGQAAKLNIGDRVPVATGSFQAGVGVGSSSAAGFVSPLVNTQFQYIDVGTNVEITPRVHPNHEVSLKISVEVSSVTNQQNIGGIQQPIISQRKVIHDIRLKEGESSVLGGLITKSDAKQISGWPGLAHVPILRYFFSDDNRNSEDDEILIVLTPHIVRMPDWTRTNLKTLYAGSETNVQVSRESDMRAPQQQQPISPEPTTAQPPAPASLVGNGQALSNAAKSAQTAQLRFEPSNIPLQAGQTATVGLVVDNVNDLFSIPLLLQVQPGGDQCGRSAAWRLSPGWRSGHCYRAASRQRAWSGDHFGDASAKHPRSERHRHRRGPRDQSACARCEHPVDCAGERQRLAAEADSISDHRSQCASEALTSRVFWVPQNGHATANAAVPLAT